MRIAYSPFITGVKPQALSKLDTAAVKMVTLVDVGVRRAVTAKQRDLRTDFLVDAGPIADAIACTAGIVGSVPDTIVAFTHTGNSRHVSDFSEREDRLVQALCIGVALLEASLERKAALGVVNDRKARSVNR